MKTRFVRLMIGISLVVTSFGRADVSFAAAIPIRWFVGLGGGTSASQITVQQQVVADFNASQTAITLTLEVVDSSIALQTLQNQIASGNAPDIVGPIGITRGDLLHGQWLDLQPIITANSYNLIDFESALLDLYRDDSEGLVSLPITIYPSFLYYNEDLFDQAGLAYPPHQYGQPYTDTTYGGAWTTDKLAEIARLLTLDNIGRNATHPSFDAGQIVQFGYLTQWASSRGEATLFGAGSFVDSNGDAQIPAQWRTAWKWHYQGMFGTQPFIPNDAYANGSPFNSNPFNSDQVAMAHTHSWYLCCLNSVTNWNIAATPSYNGTVTSKIHMDGFRILKASQHPNEAFQALTYLVGTAAPTLASAYGIGALPGRISQRPAAITALDSAYLGVDWQVLSDSVPYLDDPNHEEFLPNNQKALDRIAEFYVHMHGTAGLNMDSEINQLRSDLQYIFHETVLYLPLILR